MSTETVLSRFAANDLEAFCRNVFIACGLNPEQATQSAAGTRLRVASSTACCKAGLDGERLSLPQPRAA